MIRANLTSNTIRYLPRPQRSQPKFLFPRSYDVTMSLTQAELPDKKNKSGLLHDVRPQGRVCTYMSQASPSQNFRISSHVFTYLQNHFAFNGKTTKCVQHFVRNTSRNKTKLAIQNNLSLVEVFIFLSIPFSKTLNLCSAPENKDCNSNPNKMVKTIDVSAIFNTFNFRFRFPPAMAVGKPARVICTPKATRHTCEINNAAPVTGYNVQLTYSPYTITQNIFKLLKIM